MPDTTYQPGTTVVVNGVAAVIPGSAHSTSVKPCLLLKPSTATYKNGYDVTDAQYGDLNAGEGNIYQCQIKEIHPQSNTAWDKTTAYAVSNPIDVIMHQLNKVYWLKGSSLTIAVDGKIITAAAGLVAAQTEHNATLKQHHYWTCVRAVSAATYVKGRYMGILNMYTTTS